MTPPRPGLLLCLLLCAAPARAAEDPAGMILAAADHPTQLMGNQVKPPEKIPPKMAKEAESPRQPLPLRLMISPLKRGMFIRLPIMDTNPNRGETFGFMPIWVLQGKGDPRIRHIHAPSVTYNQLFKWIPTYRYYWYPTDVSALVFRTSISGTEDRELMVEYETTDFLGEGLSVAGKFQIDGDGSKRFYGLGPATEDSAETNYSRRLIQYFWRVGLPLFEDSGLKFNVGHHLAGQQVRAGVIEKIVDTQTRFRRLVPVHTHQDSELQLFVDYDTRDSAVTTTRGLYGKFAMETSQREIGSEFVFQRYTMDLRAFFKPARIPPTTAFNVRIEQLAGSAPFYLMPQLGGKQIHRGYGEGRFVDKGLLTTSLEERFTVYKAEVAGVTTELELAPFVGLGTVFSSPDHMQRKYFRPVYGGAVRAVARPQVVGSIDFGVGQEGTSIFMDINYPF